MDLSGCTNDKKQNRGFTFCYVKTKGSLKELDILSCIALFTRLQFVNNTRFLSYKSIETVKMAFIV